jgi:muramoyltetrapeptide carboxypeptidase
MKTVDVIALSSANDSEVELSLIREHITQLIPGWKFNFPKKVPRTEINLAGDDSFRVKQFKAACESGSDIIWLLRGGYGLSRIMLEIDDVIDELDNKPKTVIGYSDATPLLLHLSQNYGWPCIHGAVLSEIINESKDKDNFTAIQALIEGKEAPGPLNNLQQLTDKGLHDICGRKKTGGNLSLIANSIATPWQMNAENRVVCIEEVGEEPYAVDRNLQQLYNAEVLSGAKALVFGDMGATEENKKDMDWVLDDFAAKLEKRLGLPVYKAAEFGHDMINIPFWLK